MRALPLDLPLCGGCSRGCRGPVTRGVQRSLQPLRCSTNSAHCAIRFRRRSTRLLLMYACSTSFPRVWAKEASATAQGVSVCSRAQVLKLERKPWTVARSARPVSRSTFVSVVSESGLPGLSGDGKTSPEPSLSRLARTRTFNAASARGTRCSAPFFMRDSGKRHSFSSRSISAQVAPRASPLLAAVRIKNRKQYFTANEA